MISKLIVWGEDRSEAINKLHEALRDYKVLGLPTNIKFLKRVLENPTFAGGEFDTSFIEQHEEALLGSLKTSDSNV
jgi:acetyl/propionyl-CoA carboxylase alpha subunit